MFLLGFFFGPQEEEKEGEEKAWDDDVLFRSSTRVAAWRAAVAPAAAWLHLRHATQQKATLEWKRLVVVVVHVEVVVVRTGRYNAC